MRRVFPIVLILMAATLLRFHDIDAQSLWHDEGNSLRLAERTIPDLIEATSRDIHAPGYYLILKGWITTSGSSELSLRVLSAFWSIITVAATYALAKLLTGNRIAANWAALLLTLHPFAVYYAQETRMYAQLGAVSILSLWILLGFIHAKRQQQWLWGVGLAGVNGLGLYTHYTFPFTMIVQGLYFLWWWLAKHGALSKMMAYIRVNLLSLTLFLPWLPTTYDQVTTWPSTGDTSTLSERLDRIFTVLVYGQSVTDTSTFYLLLPLLLIGVGIGGHGRRKLHLLTIPVLLIVFSVGSLLFSGAYRESNLKFLIPAQAATAILLASGLAVPAFYAPKAFYQRIGGIVLAAGLSLIFLQPSIGGLATIFNDSDYARSDYRAIAQHIQRLESDESAIILNAPNQQEVFSYYYQGESEVVPLPPGLGGDDDTTASLTQDVIAAHERIFLVLWGQQERDPNAIVQSTLDNNAYVVGRQWITDVELVQYVVLGEPASEPAVILDVAFGENITLRGYTLSDGSFVAGQGDALGVTLFWETSRPLEERYKVSVQVLTPQGTLADQHDGEPANGLRPTTTWQAGEQIIDNHGLILDTSLAPGTYTLNVVLYDINDADRRITPANGNPDQILELAELNLIPAD